MQRTAQQWRVMLSALELLPYPVKHEDEPPVITDPVENILQEEGEKSKMLKYQDQRYYGRCYGKRCYGHSNENAFLCLAIIIH